MRSNEDMTRVRMGPWKFVVGECLLACLEEAAGLDKSKTSVRHERVHDV